VSKLSKIFIGFGFTFLVIGVAFFFFLRYLVIKSYPVTDGVHEMNGLHAPVDVLRDEYGVPHINGRDEHDLMFTMGYVHAQDRLWQMDLMRRAGEGRLSEIFGTSTVDIDVLFRTIGLRNIADSIEQYLHPDSRRILEEYAAGVNAFITQNKGKYPIEFDMLNYVPEPWTLRHSILISRLIAWELNLAWWTDLTYGEIATKVSAEKMSEIIPTFPDSIQVTVPSNRLKKSLSGLRTILDAAKSYREVFGLGNLEAGSNGWTVDSSKSLSGKPLLANDPHLAMPCPSRWYEVHLTAPGWNVAGVSLPGVPLIVIGHNEHLAWGLTNAMLDDADFYVEQIDSTNSNHYIMERSSFPMKVRYEKILVENSDSIVLAVRSTHHGPIINDVHPTHLHRDSLYNRSPIAMRWTGLDASDETYGIYLMNRATNSSEFEQGLKEIGVPGQAVVYADVDGNIAYWTTGHVPIRGKQFGMLPQSGSSAQNEWKGYLAFEQLPKLWNPPEGYIACANQKIADDSYPYYLSTLWEPASRIQRIRALLHSAEKFTAEDFKQFQQDVVSPYAQEVTRHILQAFDTSHVSDQSISDALGYFRNWDFRFTQGDVATSIFNEFVVKLIYNIFEDEMGPDVFHDFVFFGAIPYRVTSQLLEKDDSPWFDNVNTPQPETKNEILQKSLSEAIKELQTLLGGEMKTWRWGTMHTVTFNHPFGKRKPLDKVFNIGPFPISGGGTTVNKSEYKFTSPFSTSVGPSMRQVVDMAEPLEASMVITSGQSGQPFHKHFDDQTPLWLNGGYHTVTMDWNKINKTNWEHLTLIPQP
jgi:penicillin amidase